MSLESGYQRSTGCLASPFFWFYRGMELNNKTDSLRPALLKAESQVFSGNVDRSLAQRDGGSASASWILGIALVSALYLMYSPVFLSDYLMNDEWIWIGSRLDLVESAKQSFFSYGRCLFGIYTALVYRFVQYDPFRIQIIRFANFASYCLVALVLFAIIKKTSRSLWLSFFLVLFLFSERSYQGTMAYSLQMISNTQPAVWLGLLAFFVQFYTRETRIRSPLRILAVTILLLLAMQSTQIYAFFALIPLTYLTLREWNTRSGRIVEFLLIAIVVFAASAITYKLGLRYWHAHGMRGYALGEQSVNAINQRPLRIISLALNPTSYWSAFELWSYPFPFDQLPPILAWRERVSDLLMSLWAVILIACFVTEFRSGTANERRGVVMKWVVVIIWLGFGAVFIAVDSPLAAKEHRPHMIFLLSGVATIAGAYALQVLSQKSNRWRSSLPKSLVAAAILMNAFGAQAGTLRGFVDNRVAEINFIRTELTSVNPATYHTVMVILPNWRGCLNEPCGPWVGNSNEYSQIGEPAAYRFALATVGVAPDTKNIVFSEQTPTTLAPDVITVDWQKFAAEHRAQMNFLWHHS